MRSGAGGVCAARRRRRYHRAMPDVLLVLLIILGVVLVWRGPKTLPKIGEALGRGVKAARDEAKTDGEPPEDEAPQG